MRTTMTHGSLFSGIGGFDLAAEWMGWTNVFHCEWNPFGQKVLQHYWPNATSYHDITKTDFTVHRGRIDILTGGFPCQPYSQAGKRLGKADERHLWPHMLRAIREIRPTFVVGENVSGLLNWNGGVVFDEVQTELEAEGYEVQSFVLPACAVNAPHRRDRVWIVANTDGERRNNGSDNWQERHVLHHVGASEGNKPERDGRERGVRQVVPIDTDRAGQRLEGGAREVVPGRGCRPTGIRNPDAPNAADSRLKGMRSKWQDAVLGTTEIGNWQDFPTQPPICGGDDGLPSGLDGITFPKWRNESVKAYGNAIVPQVAYQIFKAIEHTNKRRMR